MRYFTSITAFEILTFCLYIQYISKSEVLKKGCQGFWEQVEKKATEEKKTKEKKIDKRKEKKVTENKNPQEKENRQEKRERRK